MKSIIFTRPTSLSPGINRSYFLSYTSPLNFQSVHRTREALSRFHLPRVSHSGEYRGEFVPPRLLFRECAQSFSPSRSHRATAARAARCGAGQRRPEKSLSQNGCPYLRDSGAEAFSELPPPTVYHRRHHLLRDSMGSATAWSWNDPTAEKAFA